MNKFYIQNGMKYSNFYTQLLTLKEKGQQQ